MYKFIIFYYFQLFSFLFYYNIFNSAYIYGELYKIDLNKTCRITHIKKIEEILKIRIIYM